jgi:hypothetical protein
VRRVYLEAISPNVDLIQHAAEKGEWRAAAWLLERRCPESFGKPEIQLNQQIAVQSNNDWSLMSAPSFPLTEIALCEGEREMLEDPVCTVEKPAGFRGPEGTATNRAEAQNQF